jgi:hypothetical protein
MQTPSYNKPDTPGIAMTFDNTVAVYHVVGPEDTFEKAARDVVALLREAEDRFPGWPRTFYLDIHGHVDEGGRFSEDFVEFQQEFLFSVVGPFVTAMEAPLPGGVINPEPQRNDVPSRLRLGPPTGGRA